MKKFLQSNQLSPRLPFQKQGSPWEQVVFNGSSEVDGTTRLHFSYPIKMEEGHLNALHVREALKNLTVFDGDSRLIKNFAIILEGAQGPTFRGSQGGFRFEVNSKAPVFARSSERTAGT